MKKLSLLALSFIFFANTSFTQVNTPKASPLAKVSQTVGLTQIDYEYSRPSVNGREIFGALIPFGKVWRTGANSATKITFSTDVNMDGKKLSKGTYALYVKPNKDSWEIIFYSELGSWGLPPVWDSTKVALSSVVKVVNEVKSAETFSISLNDLKYESVNLKFEWAKTSATLNIQLPTVEMALKSIDKTMSGPGESDYFSAATFYFEQNIKLDTALVYVKKAIALKGEDVYWMLRRQALIEQKLGDKKAALISANRALVAAQKTGNPEAIQISTELVNELK
jgi:hypothetical protein